MALVAIDRLRLPNDETLIPRLRDEPYLVSEYAAAMRVYDGWGAFPAVETDQDGLVLSGVHRVLAATEVGISRVPVKRHECTDAAERLLIAAAGNALHGRRWSTKDIVKVALFAERIGVPQGQLARAMCLSETKLQRIPVTTVMRRGTTEERIYAKRAVRHAVRGRVLSESEERVMLDLTTPNLADAILLDLLRLGELDALPTLDVDSYRSVTTAIELLTGWLARDSHLLEAA